MTALCVIVDRNTGEYAMSSAAHQPSYLLQPETEAIRTFILAGNRLGETRDLDAPFMEIKGTLALGEKIVFFTDGLQDLGPDEKLLNKKGVHKFLKENIKTDTKETIAKVESELLPLNVGLPLRDDVTIVILERIQNA